VEVRVLGGLDGLVRDSSAVGRAACLAHRRGEESSALLDRKMRCLDRQRDAAAMAIAVLQRTTGVNLAQAVDVVVGLSPPAWCADSTRVLEDVEPPATIALDRQVRELRARISQAAALDRAGRSEEAAVVARAAIDDADRTAYPPVVAEAELELGRILISQNQGVAAAEILRKACNAALASGAQPRLAVEAGARLIYVEGAHAPDLDRLQRDLLYLEPMSRALAHDRFARPLLFNNVAEVYRIAGRPDEARHYLELARDALGGAPSDIELTIIDRNLAMLTPDPTSRMELTRSAWIETRDALGDHHLRSLQAKAQYALFQTDVGKAHELLADLCVAYHRFHAPLLDAQLECELVRAYVASESGALDDAERAYAWIVDATALSSSAEHAVHRELATGELALLHHQLERAVPAFRAVIDAPRPQRALVGAAASAPGRAGARTRGDGTARDARRLPAPRHRGDRVCGDRADLPSHHLPAPPRPGAGTARVASTISGTRCERSSLMGYANGMGEDTLGKRSSRDNRRMPQPSGPHPEPSFCAQTEPGDCNGMICGGGNSPFTNIFPINGMSADGAGACNRDGIRLEPHSLQGPKCTEADSDLMLDDTRTKLVGKKHGRITCAGDQLDGASFTVRAGRQSLPLTISQVRQFDDDSPYHQHHEGYQIKNGNAQLCDLNAAREALYTLGFKKVPDPEPKPLRPYGYHLGDNDDLVIAMPGPAFDVNTAEPIEHPDPAHFFNLACVGDALAKASFYKLTGDARDTMAALRMITANYCGKRMTVRGMHIEWESYPPPLKSKVLEAEWDRDGRALCIEKPRLMDLRVNSPSEIFRPQELEPGLQPHGCRPVPDEAWQMRRGVLGPSSQGRVQRLRPMLSGQPVAGPVQVVH